MEQEKLMDDYPKLVDRIKEDIREVALTIPRFADTKEGCIRIMGYPECPLAYRWMGGVGRFDHGDIPDIECSFPILPGGTRVARFVNQDGGINIADTYSMTAMKIAQLSFRQQDREAMISIPGHVDGLTFDGGFANWRGAICCAISFSDGAPFCMLYISVSGAKQDEDLKCAMASTHIIKHFFQWYGFKVDTPWILVL